MKKFLLIGLVILIGSNAIALSGVAYNRIGAVTSELTLTERELGLPYNSGMNKENSGILFGMNWRTATRVENAYNGYNSHEAEVTQAQLLALGFEVPDNEYYGAQSRQLYWALEFDGALHTAEITKAELRYQAALETYTQQPNENNLRLKDDSLVSLKKEKLTNSRLFFVKAALDYESLAAEFSGQDNMLFVKGLAKPYYNVNNNSYRLLLRELLVSNIMVPLEYSEDLSGLSRLGYQDITAPRYTVDIKWGSRLEPWITNVTNKQLGSE
ncbi:hypothetical protein CXF83_21755 [Shewanella sp. Choline-02u-19]|uniref:DUF4824 family protein n=1 Tax=unclassified Shewanella TaxID=196818 RepID=UPI000C3360A8|nr:MULTISPECIES: DUF4824 family protein [unclassified Shewanella]PKH60386.1 hypothetical protein CXF84_02560 [Shewanella sp. Bg11-22]PKI29145.1 hypothetical protein CXF83_21755 [Shewanella sp. Choline-02u-19]